MPLPVDGCPTALGPRTVEGTGTTDWRRQGDLDELPDPGVSHPTVRYGVSYPRWEGFKRFAGTGEPTTPFASDSALSLGVTRRRSYDVRTALSRTPRPTGFGSRSSSLPVFSPGGRGSFVLSGRTRRPTSHPSAPGPQPTTAALQGRGHLPLPPLGVSHAPHPSTRGSHPHHPRWNPSPKPDSDPLRHRGRNKRLSSSSYEPPTPTPKGLWLK